jgi:hypothetical protein
MMKRLVFALALCIVSLPVQAENDSFSMAIGPYANVKGRCSIAIGEYASVEGNNMIVIAGQPARPIYEITPAIVGRIYQEIARMVIEDEVVARQAVALPDIIDRAIDRFNQNCGKRSV